MTIKILCICDGGNVRSVAMVQYIKELNGKWEERKEDFKLTNDAIAIGEKETSKETMDMLRNWADKIIDMREHLPVDLWHNPRHPDLRKKVEELWFELEAKHHLE